MNVERKDVPEEEKWGIEALYPSPEEWEEDFQKLWALRQESPSFATLRSFQGRLGEGADLYAQLLTLYFDLTQKAERLYVYAHLRSDEQLSSSEGRKRQGQALALLSALSEATSWIEPESLALPLEQLASYRDASSCATYHFFIEKLIRLQPHTLSEAEEKLMSMAARPLGASRQAYSVLADADLAFGEVKDGEGTLHPLSQSSYMLYQRSRDRALRSASYLQLHRVFHAHENTLCELLQGEIQSHWFEARARRYKSCLEAALFPKAIDLQVYHRLIEEVHEGLPQLHRYLHLRKEVLGVEELHLYDLSAPVTLESEEKIPYERAVEEILIAAQPLGQEYVDLLKEGLTDQRWVDRAPNLHKRSGAYSSGCYGSLPFILMNWHGTRYDQLTLAHEAGHSMHSALSWKHQPYCDSSYPIFVAEVASTFLEELLFRRLLSQAAKKEQQIALLIQKMDDIRATLFRQTQFAEFELWLHEMVEQDQPLTPVALRERYTELNQLYYGPVCALDAEGASEWARIPHFYYNYYVYQYATGISCALELAERVVEGGEPERKAYLSFLSAGGSRFPADLLRTAGVDVCTPDPVRAAMRRFSELADELEVRLKDQSDTYSCKGMAAS